MLLPTLFPLAAGMALAAARQGRPVTPGGTWPATGRWLELPLAVEFPPENVFTAHYVWLAAVVVTIAVVGVLGLLKLRDAVVREIQGTLRSEERPAKLHLQQPVQIEHVSQFVRVDHFNATCGEIDKRFMAIEKQIEKTVRASESYLHAMRHELRNEMQALRLAAQESRQTALSSSGKVHGRVDGVAESLAKVSGSVESLSQQLGEIRQLLMERALQQS